MPERGTLRGFVQHIDRKTPWASGFRSKDNKRKGWQGGEKKKKVTSQTAGRYENQNVGATRQRPKKKQKKKKKGKKKEVGLEKTPLCWPASMWVVGGKSPSSLKMGFPLIR